jgi:hypothetical protein
LIYLATPAGGLRQKVFNGLQGQTCLKAVIDAKGLSPAVANRRPLIAPRRIVSVPQWAEIAGLADDGISVAVARRLLDSGQGPTVVSIGKRRGVQLQDHALWARSQPWAKYLAASAAEREKRERHRSLKRRSN